MAQFPVGVFGDMQNGGKSEGSGNGKLMTAGQLSLLGPAVLPPSDMVFR